VVPLGDDPDRRGPIMAEILFSWLGTADLMAPVRDSSEEPGPVYRLLRRHRFDRAYLFNDMPAGGFPAGGVSIGAYVEWVRARVPDLDVQIVAFPNCLAARYRQALEEVDARVNEMARVLAPGDRVHVLTSPGTPAHVLALLVATQRFRPTVWATWKPRETGGERREDVERLEWPFRLYADLSPNPYAGEWRLPVPSEYEPCPEFCTEIVGASEALRGAMWLAERVAPSPDPVLLVGETGTGKELFARAIHARSGRRNERFCEVNCAGIPETLLESELFGHKKGAFTGADCDREGLFEKADKGTLFLDEIGDMPMSLQAKLLRALQGGKIRRVGETEEKSVNVRVIAATHRDLQQLCREGRFREDLYYRLATFVIRIPPLRLRGKDLDRLAARFWEEGCREARRENSELPPAVLSALGGYGWPGNVRELRSVMRWLAWVVPPGEPLGVGHVTAALRQHSPVGSQSVLCRMSDAEFLAGLAAHLDELICRYQQGRVSLETIGSPPRGLLDGFLRPLLFVRAARLARGNLSEAGRLLGRGKLDRSKGDLNGEEDFARQIDERRVREIRGFSDERV